MRLSSDWLWELDLSLRVMHCAGGGSPPRRSPGNGSSRTRCSSRGARSRTSSRLQGGERPARPRRRGDRVLQESANRLRSVLRDEHLLGRFGGDESVVVLSGRNAAGSDLAARVCSRPRDAMAPPIAVDGVACQLGASIGTATYPDDAVELTALLQIADAATYEAKWVRRAVAYLRCACVTRGGTPTGAPPLIPRQRPSVPGASPSRIHRHGPAAHSSTWTVD